MGTLKFSYRILVRIGLLQFLVFAAPNKTFAFGWPDLQNSWRAQFCQSEFTNANTARDLKKRIQQIEQEIFRLARNEGYTLQHLRGLMAQKTVKPEIRAGLVQLIRDYALLASLDERGEPAPESSLRELRHIAMIAQKVCMAEIEGRKLPYKERELALGECNDFTLIADDADSFVHLVTDHVVTMERFLKRSVSERNEPLRKLANRQSLEECSMGAL